MRLFPPEGVEQAQDPGRNIEDLGNRRRNRGEQAQDNGFGLGRLRIVAVPLICARYTTYPSTTPAATETGNNKPIESRSPAFSIMSTISVRNAIRGSSPKSWLKRPIDRTVSGFLLGMRWNRGLRGTIAELSISLPHLPQYL